MIHDPYFKASSYRK